MSLVITVVTVIAAFAAGIGIWTVTEYALHRWAMHSMGGRGPVAKEHLTHHAKPTWTSKPLRIVAHLAMTAGVVGVAVVATRWLPTPLVVGLAVGFSLSYLAYEQFHFRAHHHPPIGRDGSVIQRWDLRLRRRHFHHHFVAPKKNMGVLVAGWDRLFGTEATPETIIVPRRLVMSWLVDEDGQVLERYADSYVIAGSRRLDVAQQHQDLVDAFANRAPVVE